MRQSLPPPCKEHSQALVLQRRPRPLAIALHRISPSWVNGYAKWKVGSQIKAPNRHPQQTEFFKKTRRSATETQKNKNKESSRNDDPVRGDPRPLLLLFDKAQETRLSSSSTSSAGGTGERRRRSPPRLHPDVDPTPKPRRLSQALAVAAMVFFVCLQFLPASHVRDPSDPPASGVLLIPIERSP
ncbi:hypothetical protein QJS10_CPA01g00765 [Acorus calamus]|uniref:Uncharacterized protein n=1 Tax=Acorus calamus TaxID=4465 RepID=A0AAV9FIE7_ACOCL|nr:hypothetical protein QJS10_CPA01g00765 [Acorus calamus]